MATALASDQDGQLDDPARVRAPTCRAAASAPRGQAEAEAEDDQALELVAGGAVAAAHAEGEPAVGGGVGDAVTQQGDEVRRDARPVTPRSSRNSSR